MSEQRCACGRFIVLPAGMAQLEDGVYHVAEGDVGACEIVTLRARLAEVERERDKWDFQARVYSVSADSWQERAERAEAALHEEEERGVVLRSALTNVEAALARAREVLREVDERTREGCPMCGGFVGCLSGRHDPTCTLKAALEEP